MSLILIHGDRFSGGRELAQSLAECLGYRLLTRDVVIERAAAWGGSQEKLGRFLAEPPGWLDRFLCSTRTQLLLLRAALAEDIRNGDGVCYGEVADLLLQEDVPMVRIRISASAESRIRAVRGLLKFSEAEATAFLKRSDRARKEWLRLMHGRKQAEAAPDLLINVDRIGLPEACDTIATLVRRRSTEACRGSDEALLEDFALSSRTSAALAVDPATAHLELAVESDLGRVSIRGSLREAQDPIEVYRVARSVHGVSEVSVNGEELGRPAAPQVIADHDRFVWQRPRPAFVALGVTLAMVLLFSALVSRFGSFVEQTAFSKWGNSPVTITGVVTDSRCGARHSQADSAECVRACVALGAKYVMDDGKSRYELSDQRDADRYAAREVRVKGVLEKGARYLKVESMQTL